jgi:hypothetical protein
MKTPRELLLERHRAAEPKLDALRQETVANLAERRADGPVRAEGSAVNSRTRPSAPRPSWRDLLLSFRWHLAGLSAAWLFVMALNLDQSPTPSPALAKQNTPSPQQLLTALRENRRQVLEMTGTGVVAGVPEARRRSEIKSPMEMA